MVIKIFALLWALLIASAVLVLVTTGFGELTLTIFALATSTLAFGALIAVLPWWIDKTFTWDADAS